MRLYLARHGQTDWNAAQIAQGQTDIPLNSVGRDQAHALAQAFEGVRLDRIVSSDLIRASETARAVGDILGLSVELDSRLRERSFGEWEGRPYHDFHVSMRERAETDGTAYEHTRPPSGESLSDVADRVSELADEVIARGGATLLVSHGGALSMLLGRLLGGDVRFGRAFRFENAGIAELHRRPEGDFTLVRLNAAHLIHDRSAIPHGPSR